MVEHQAVVEAIVAQDAAGAALVKERKRSASVIQLLASEGASIDDPEGLFTSSLDANVRRAVDLHSGDTIDATAFQALVRAAAARNSAS